MKWGLFAIVLYFVIQYGYQQWQQIDPAQIQWSPGWLFVAVLCYFLAWLPAAWVWGEMLRSSGTHLPCLSLIRAHFCGHVGKYIPGKALSLVIRAALVKEYGVSMGLAGVLATAETLITMATGLVLTVILLPAVLAGAKTSQLSEVLPQLQFFVDANLTSQMMISAGLFGVACLGLPVFVRGLQFVMDKLEQKSAPDEHDEIQQAERQLNSLTVMKWGMMLMIGWGLNGASLGLVLWSIGIDEFQMTSPLLWTCAVAGATSLGFLVLFAPGGLGVREAILIAVLQLSASIDAPTAVMAALLLRLVSFTSEVVFAILLYGCVGRVSSH